MQLHKKRQNKHFVREDNIDRKTDRRPIYSSVTKAFQERHLKLYIYIYKETIILPPNYYGISETVIAA